MFFAFEIETTIFHGCGIHMMDRIVFETKKHDVLVIEFRIHCTLHLKGLLAPQVYERAAENQDTN